MPSRPGRLRSPATRLVRLGGDKESWEPSDSENQTGLGRRWAAPQLRPRVLGLRWGEPGGRAAGLGAVARRGGTVSARWASPSPVAGRGRAQALNQDSGPQRGLGWRLSAERFSQRPLRQARAPGGWGARPPHPALTALCLGGRWVLATPRGQVGAWLVVQAAAAQGNSSQRPGLGPALESAPRSQESGGLGGGPASFQVSHKPWVELATARFEGWPLSSGVAAGP